MPGLNFTASRLYFEGNRVNIMISVFRDTSDADAADVHISFVLHFISAQRGIVASKVDHAIATANAIPGSQKTKSRASMLSNANRYNV